MLLGILFEILDSYLANLETLDWITPLTDLGKDVAYYSNSTTLKMSRSTSVGSVRRELRKYGIECWGRVYQKDTFTIQVKGNQAEAAKSILGIK